MSIESCWGLICFVPIDADGFKKIFGFSEFLAALALLAVLYTITDVRYKFRVAVTPGFLFPATYALIAFIGVATLMTELWVAQKWFVPKTWGLNLAVWQSSLGLLFLGTFLTWTYYAYIYPPVFGYRNGKRFLSELIRYVLRGNDEELRVVVNELARSSSQVVKHWKPKKDLVYDHWNPAHRNLLYAQDIFDLLGDRRICKIIVKSSPVTALAFFEDMAQTPLKLFPMSTCSRNITMEAVAQKDSFLYSEVEGYQSGFMGYTKPISLALYGNYPLIESIQRAGGLGTFDVDLTESQLWDGSQWSAYLRAVLITVKSFLATGRTNDQEPVISSALNNLEWSYSGLSKISGMEDPYSTKQYEAFHAVCQFVTKAIDLVNKAEIQPYVHHVRRETYPRNIYDQLAEVVCQLCIDSAYVKGPFMTAWTFQHNMAWSALHGFKDGAAWTAVRTKTRRLLYEQIERMVDSPNYVSIRAVAFCLNVFGLAPLNRKDKYSRRGYALSRKAQTWAKEYYLTLVRDYPEMAEKMIIGSISFDKESARLVQTNNYGMKKTITRKFLELQPAKPEVSEHRL
jgi:hypothetical protein